MRLARRVARILVLGRRNGYRARVLRAFGLRRDPDEGAQDVEPAGNGAVDVELPAGFVAVLDASAVPPGEIVEVIHDGTPLAVANVDGELYALDNVCPHAGGPIGDGELEGHLVTCPFHGWSFDVRDGSCATVEGMDVPTFEVRQVDDAICVRMP